MYQHMHVCSSFLNKCVMLEKAHVRSVLFDTRIDMVWTQSNRLMRLEKVA